MDIVTYALLKKKMDGMQEEIDNVTLAYSYKGSVATVGDLPLSAAVGDLYTVDSFQYVWDGTEWVQISQAKPITNEQIDNLFEEG